MAWKIKDEWIDLAQGKHVVIFHNTDIGAEHHLIHEFKLAACPHCGEVKPTKEPAPRLVWDGEPMMAAHHKPRDFAAIKQSTHDQLNAHHQQLMTYRAQHPHARIGSGTKK